MEEKDKIIIHDPIDRLYVGKDGSTRFISKDGEVVENGQIPLPENKTSPVIETKDGMMTEQFSLNPGLYGNLHDVTAAILRVIEQLRQQNIVLVDKKTNKEINEATLPEIIGNILSQNETIRVKRSDTDSISRSEHTIDVNMSNDNVRPNIYINLEELKKALTDYFGVPIVIPEPVPDVSEYTPPKETVERTVVRVTEKRKRPLWPPIAAALAALIIAINMQTVKSGNDPVNLDAFVQQETIERVVSDIEEEYHVKIAFYDNLKSSIERNGQVLVKVDSNGHNDAYVDKDTSEVIGNKENSAGNPEQSISSEQESNLYIHDNYTMPAHTDYYEYSDKTGNEKAYDVDKKLPVSGFAICKKMPDGSLEYLYSGGIPNTNIGEDIYEGDFLSFINSKTQGISKEDADNLVFMIHLGYDNVNRTGWIDVTDMVKVVEEKTNPAPVIEKTVTKLTNYTVHVDSFNGNTITVHTALGDAVVPIKDSNGNYLQSGSKVTGSDGREYIINNINVRGSKGNDASTNNNFGLDVNLACPALAALLGGALANFAAGIYTKKKNEEAEKNPYFHEFANNKGYEEFLESFKASREKYEKQSTFSKIFTGRKFDVVKKLTDEQVKKLYSAIINSRIPGVTYDPESKLLIERGQIYEVSKDGERKNITEYVLPYIAEIGKDNDIVAKGSLEGSTLEPKQEGRSK